MTNFYVWGFEVDKDLLNDEELQYLSSLPSDLPSVDWVSKELDRIWDEQDLDNKQPLSNQNIGNYYSHPVWLMNGIFSAKDYDSLQHRELISKFLISTGKNKFADFGGGFGQLAICMAKESKEVNIFIIEPYPTKVGAERIRENNNINIVPSLKNNEYEAIVAQDVLEHVDDPINLAFEIAQSVSLGGYVIFANCFFPTIKSHIPSTFHLRTTFPYIMKALGLDYIGIVDGAPHAQIFIKNKNLNFKKAKRYETISKLIGPILNNVKKFLSPVKKLIMKK